MWFEVEGLYRAARSGRWCSDRDRGSEDRPARPMCRSHEFAPSGDRVAQIVADEVAEIDLRAGQADGLNHEIAAVIEMPVDIERQAAVVLIAGEEILALDLWLLNIHPGRRAFWHWRHIEHAVVAKELPLVGAARVVQVRAAVHGAYLGGGIELRQCRGIGAGEDDGLRR